MKRIGRSKNPLSHQLPIIVENLREKLNVSCFIDIGAIAYKNLDRAHKYGFSFVPGLDGSGCTSETFTSWPKLLNRYFKLMKGSS